MTTPISVRDIVKSFTPTQGRAALNGVSLDVASGELMALLGPSGSGKTTLLRIIAGLEIADSGTVHFGSEDASAKTVQERRVGFVFQNYALFKHLTVEENVAFGLEIRPAAHRPAAAEIRRRARELIELVQLAGLEKRRPTQLSGGQRQRVALARALAVEPKVLLLDEPFGALDAKVRRDLRHWLRAICTRTGHTTIFVTHDQDEALELADRVAVLNGGRIEQVGTPDDVYDHPATPFVHSFIGEASVLAAEARAGYIHIGSHALYLPTPHEDARGSFFMRPQDVAISDGEGAAHDAEIIAMRRTGATRRAEIALADALGRVEIEVPAAITFRPGDRIKVRFIRGSFFPEG